MPTVLGKKELCSCELRSITDVQGKGNFPLYKRYDDIENVIKDNIAEQYRNFLSQPVESDNEILWFTKSYSSTPIRLSQLQDGKENYEKIKDDTLKHYREIIDKLKKIGNDHFDILEKALKYINEDFIYCYDNIVVLGLWGMTLKASNDTSGGKLLKDLFPPKTPTPESGPDDDDETPPKSYSVKFISGEHGIINSGSEIIKQESSNISESDIPDVTPNKGFEFTGWNANPLNYLVSGDVEFTATYKPIHVPWYKRLWNWITTYLLNRRFLKWLAWFIFILLLILLLCCLFRACRNNKVSPIPYPISNKQWINEDKNVGKDGGIYHPGNPYDAIPTPDSHKDILPQYQGVLPPVDSTNILRTPGNPVIVNNRLNILMENEDKSIIDLAKDFKLKFPDDKYKVIYYDEVVKRMQIEVPPDERTNLKQAIPGLFAPEYSLFVFDESLFQTGHIPNDPDFASADKSWYLKSIGATAAWDITKGSTKLTIAIVDNGFSLNHPELKYKVVMPYNVWSHSKDVFSQKTDHGTHVAGTALAYIDNNKGLCGIAPECSFMPVQIADKNDIMTTTSILDGILYALYQGADVINVSLEIKFAGSLPQSVQYHLQNNYFKEEERLWKKVMDISEKHNAIIVVAAGNGNILAGINPMNRPKNFIIVSAVAKNNSSFQKTSFSNYGERSTISAPGVDIYSTIGENNYQMMTGTSMAAPIITGSVALMKSINENLTSEQIVCILQSTGIAASGNIGNVIQLHKALLMVKSGNYTDCKSVPQNPSSGDVQVLLNWNNYNDLDLVVVDPNNESIWFNNKRSSSGGMLEIDMNVSYPGSTSPIENIYWPRGTAPYGTYNVYLVYYRKHINFDETPYTITVKYGANTETYNGKISRNNHSVPICSFTLGQGNNPMNHSDSLVNKLIEEREILKNKLKQIDIQLENIKKSTK
jgi:subtilisin family serine protease